jgi:hypothetical protein
MEVVIMKAVVEVLVKALVEDPDQVVLQEFIQGNEATYILSVAKEDMGRVIGRQGRIAKAIRTILKATATRQRIFVNLEIVDPVSDSDDSFNETGRN